MIRAALLFSLLLALPLAADDLVVGWISREPELAYVWNSSNPTREGWPIAGSNVTWRAHVRGEGENVGYRWLVDGRQIASGTVTINGAATVDLQRPWTFTREKLTFTIGDDALTVFTDALAVGFWVEQSLYDYFRTNGQPWETWAQRQIELYNDMAALAVYPETPNGVLDRWRIQKIVVVPDGALPLTPLVPPQPGSPNGSAHPDPSDRGVDLMWGFRAATKFLYADTRTMVPGNPFYLAPVLIHELGHARYLNDVYAWTIHDNGNEFRIDITENGQRVAGSALMPMSANGTVHFTPEIGLMSSDYTFIDRYSAIALNRIAGRRAVRGNYNDPENVGEFLNDLPLQNRLTIRDAAGNPIPDAEVTIYQAVGGMQAWYAATYDDVPDLTLQTDAKGQVLVGRSPFGAKLVSYFGESNLVAIVRVAKGGVVRYGFLESRIFNLAYWRGETAFADHELVVGAPLCNNASPKTVAPRWDERTGREVQLQWDVVSDATRYDVWASIDGAAPRMIATTTAPSYTTTFSGRVWWWVEAFTASCPPTRTVTSRFVAPAIPARRRSVS